ncbi:MAG: tetratricopeptide repeat protein [bacterium]
MNHLYKFLIIIFVLLFKTSFAQFTPKMLFENGIEAYYDARFQDAIKYFDEYIKSNNSDFKGYNYRGLCYQSLKNYPRSIEDFTSVITVTPNNSDGYLNRGNSYVFNNNIPSAMEDYGNALRLTPNMIEAYFAKGRVFMQLRKFEDALKAVNSTEGIDPTNSRVYLNKALVHLQMNDTVDFFNDVETALYYDSNIVFTDYRRDLMYVKIETYKNAMGLVNLLLQQNPNNSVYYFARGFIYFLLNSFTKASDDFNTSIQIHAKDDAQFNNLINKIFRSIERNSNASDK